MDRQLKRAASPERRFSPRLLAQISRPDAPPRPPRSKRRRVAPLKEADIHRGSPEAAEQERSTLADEPGGPESSCAQQPASETLSDAPGQDSPEQVLTAEAAWGMLADRLATRMVGTLANHLLTANVQRFTELARSGDLAEELEEMCNRLEAKNQDGEGGLERLAARFEEGLGRLEALENRLAQRLEGHEAADSSDTGE
jgi:hypothetical protein